MGIKVGFSARSLYFLPGLLFLIRTTYTYISDSKDSEAKHLQDGFKNYQGESGEEKNVKVLKDRLCDENIGSLKSDEQRIEYLLKEVD